MRGKNTEDDGVKMQRATLGAVFGGALVALATIRRRKRS